MPSRITPPTIWIVDPINYSGMAYYDAGLASGLSHAGARVAIVGSDKPLVVPQPESGTRLLSVFRGTGPSRPKWRRASSYVVSVGRLLRKVRRHRPTWLLWNYVEQPTLDILAIRQARRMGARVAFIAHETEPWEDDGSRRETYRQLIEDTADAIIVHGSANLQALLETWNVPESRIVVSEHGDYRDWVDPHADQGAARDRLGLARDAPIALFFGTLRMSKGLETLIDAWPAVRSSDASAQLVVAGRSYRGTDLSRLVPLADGIDLRIGAITPDAALDYYAACDVVVIPYDRVSTSGVLRYAYSAGRAVVTTDVGELRDHVPAGAGVRVATGDPVALAAAIVSLLGDRARAVSMGTTGLAYARATFDWASIGRGLLERLQDLDDEATASA